MFIYVRYRLIHFMVLIFHTNSELRVLVFPNLCNYLLVYFDNDPVLLFVIDTVMIFVQLLKFYLNM